MLVIPRLEDWFLRHQQGLAVVRALLAQVRESDRKCLLGCNSYAWAYLKRAIGADLILPDSLTFQPFDAGRLQEWFSRLNAADTTKDVVFRASKTGGDVLARDEKGELESDHLANLAARSRGIPWVAWSLWRNSLRSDQHEEDEKKEIAKHDDVTLWVVEDNEYTLPTQTRQDALLTLQALLIHGRLTVEELRLVLPIVGDSFIVAGLMSCGFVEKEGDHLTCCVSAYPSIRKELLADGIPIDEI